MRSGQGIFWIPARRALPDSVTLRGLDDLVVDAFRVLFAVFIFEFVCVVHVHCPLGVDAERGRPDICPGRAVCPFAAEVWRWETVEDFWIAVLDAFEDSLEIFGISVNPGRSRAPV